MNLSEWFGYQLKAGGDGFVWAARQIPEQRQNVTPPRGEWSALRLVFHMFAYERDLVLPYMRHRVGEPVPTREELDRKFYAQDEDFQTAQHLGMETLLTSFEQGRAEQIALLPQFDEQRWQEICETVWGNVSMRWIVSKTFQHTAQHTHDLMCMVLYWK
jgi:hypothetical protein